MFPLPLPLVTYVAMQLLCTSHGYQCAVDSSTEHGRRSSIIALRETASDKQLMMPPEWHTSSLVDMAINEVDYRDGVCDQQVMIRTGLGLMEFGRFMDNDCDTDNDTAISIDLLKFVGLR